MPSSTPYLRPGSFMKWPKLVVAVNWEIVPATPNVREEVTKASSGEAAATTSLTVWNLLSYLWTLENRKETLERRWIYTTTLWGGEWVYIYHLNYFKLGKVRLSSVWKHNFVEILAENENWLWLTRSRLRPCVNEMLLIFVGFGSLSCFTMDVLNSFISQVNSYKQYTGIKVWLKS